MDASLAALRHTDDRPPSEDELRRLTDYLLDVRLPGGLARRQRTRRIHHFQVTAVQDDRTTYPPAAEGRSWFITVSPGTVDDRPVTILYQRRQDVRGWVLPTNAAAVPEGYPYADRTLFDQDEPKPCLLILAPLFGSAPTPTDLFALVPDEARPAYFRTREMWGYDLYQASVVLSPDTSTALPPGVTVPFGFGNATITRRTRAHVHAVPRVDLLLAGMVEVARLYLLRDPEAAGGAHDDQLVVRQQLYWSLQSAQVSLTSLGVVWGPGDPEATEVTDGTEVLFWTG